MHEAKQLYEEIQAQGFSGTVRIVQRFVQALADDPEKISLPPATGADRFSSNSATWLFIRDLKQLTTEKQAELELICQRSETARKTYELTHQFMSMLRLRRGQEFETWLADVEASRIPELCRFAQSLLKDKEAVIAGLTLAYSNGPVEAQVQKRETWSSAPCLAVPNFLCYGNACSMRLNWRRAFTCSLFPSVGASDFFSQVTFR